MGVSQHPSAELRSNFAIGNLAPGEGLAVAAHIEMCESCRLAAQSGRPERNQRSRGTSKDPKPALSDADGAKNARALPPSLASLPLGRWRQLRGGVRVAPVKGAAGLGESVHLLEAAPMMPAPLPRAAELLLVLDGALQDGAKTYAAGDFLDLGRSPISRPRAGAGIGCVCLVVGDDSLYRHPLLDWLDRLRGA